MAWVEAQVITKSFREVWFFVGGRSDEDWSLLGSHQQQLSLLISSVLISSKADMLHLTFANESDRQGLLAAMSPEWGELRSILTPLRGALRSEAALGQAPLRNITIRRCSRSDWEGTTLWTKDRETLSYLIKKINRGEMPEEKSDPTSKGMIAKLFGAVKKFLNPLGLGVRR